MAKIMLSASGNARARLALTTSVLALGLVAGSPAFAQDAEETPAPVNAPNATAPTAAAAAANEAASASGEIVVTGTRIRGVAPVGSAVIPVGRADIEKLGVSTTNDALRRLPQVVNFGGSNENNGGTTIQNSSLNTFFAKSINLRGLGTASTLTLVNGHRVAPQGPNGQLFDADNIPGIAIERIEVVADGGSAIYGSDAIGGVVNFIVRRPENVFEVQARAGFADSVQEYIGSAVLGRKWDTGGILIAYEYQRRSALEAADRASLYNDDLSPYGGAQSPIFADPGNVQFVANGAVYGIPATAGTSGVSLGQLSTTPNRRNQWIGADATPKANRNSVVGTFVQDLTDFMTFRADGMFSRREYVYKGIASTATLTVPNTNPYSPCFTGRADDSATLNCPANGTVLVPYSFINSLGPTRNAGYEQIWSLAGTLEIELSEKWDLNVGGYYSVDKGRSRTTGQINTNGLNRALGATVAGVAKPANVPFFNPFCNGATAACNSQATVDLFSAFTTILSKYRTYGGTANLGGSLFSLPGGDLRIAVGGELRNDFLAGSGQISNTRTANVDTVTSAPVSKSRKVSSAYGEIFLPIFGPGNARPGFEKLELNAAVRYDRYNDVGSTTNPKFGINWAPIDGLTFRGSYGTSFRAPTLVDVNPFATAGFLPRTGSGSAVGLLPANGTFQYLYPIGGNANLKPERATTWSIGFDIAPRLIEGLQVGLTYYNIKYTDKVDTAAYNVPIGAALNSGQYDDFIVYNPAYFPTKSNLTLAQFIQYYNTITADPRLPVLGVVDPATLIAIVDARRNNSGVVKTDGLDFLMNYTIDGGWANYRIGAQANYLFHYKSAPVPTAPLRDEVNNFGYPARFTGRLELGLDSGGFSGTLFTNYVNKRSITRDFLPATVPDRYKRIGAFTTFDLSLRYDFGEADSSITNGLALSMSVLNIFDKKPPLVVNSGGASPIRFDPSYASSLGRFMSFQVTKKF